MNTHSVHPKVDFKKTLPSYKARPGKIETIGVPKLQYLMINGHGAPNQQDFADAIATLYPVAYSLKFMSKLDQGRDYVVPPLEALWWAEDMTVFTSNRDKSKWDWTVMLMVPDWITGKMYAEAVEAVKAKKAPIALPKMNLKSFAEGMCAQVLHVGPYDDEGPILKAMHDEYIPGEGYKMTGKHHEIYLNDFRKTAPEKLKTILRQPMK